jgi:type I restriction enzyme S subunit
MSLNVDRTGWKRVRFGDLVDNRNDYFEPHADGVLPYVAGPHITSGEPTVSSYGFTDDDQFPPTFKRKFQAGDVLLHSRGIEKLAMVDRTGVTGEKLFVLRSKSDESLYQAFLVWLLQSPVARMHMKANFTGSVNKFLNWRPLASMECHLPPVDEQKRIADLLWAVERHRRALSDWQAAGMRLYADTRTALLTVGPRGDWMRGKWALDAVDRWASNPPAGWSAETIDSVGRVRSGATPNRSEQARYFDGGDTPWVKTLDLNESVLVATDERITSQAVAETSAKVVPAGTVLVAMYGGFGQIGRTARLGVDAATNQAVSAILELRDDVDPEFFHEVLKAGRSKWRRVAASSRKDPNITKRDVESFDFPLPPREQQSEILAVLATVRRAIDAVADELHAVALLRASLLAEIFGGN